MVAQRIISRQTDIDYEIILLRAEEAARKAGIDLRYENLADDEINIGSGLCRIHSQPSLIIDKRLDPKRKLFIIAKELSKIDTDSIYLPPLIRELIETMRK
ncbi:hypothetical protein MNBD_NITROSPINAE04-77 [hydrothermal vent metagenome]|uniref:Uncharacterized protein n=1 Tax=hydrothermal vent metagenome TaxID=652676 RepID=A0A3B1CUJ2_9ZZZZ